MIFPKEIFKMILKKDKDIFISKKLNLLLQKRLEKTYRDGQDYFIYQRFNQILINFDFYPIENVIVFSYLNKNNDFVSVSHN